MYRSTTWIGVLSILMTAASRARSAGFSCRSYVNFTSSAVSSFPLWNFTPFRSVIWSFVGSRKRHDWARCPWSTPFSSFRKSGS